MSKLRCLNCNSVLESKYTHDFVQCECDNQSFIDGGDQYVRCGGMDMSKLKLLPTYISIDDFINTMKNGNIHSDFVMNDQCFEDFKEKLKDKEIKKYFESVAGNILLLADKDEALRLKGLFEDVGIL